MKRRVYTFLDDDGNLIVQVVADNHDIAVAQANTHLNKQRVVNTTDFYSELVD
jgi:hypothetical protein